MGGVARVLTTDKEQRNGANVAGVQHDPGGGAVATGDHYSAPGDDAVPLPGDYAITTDVRREGGEDVVGYIDPKNEHKAGPGEKRIYGRDPSTGDAVVELWLKSDGSMIGQNALGFFALLANGNVNINGVIIDPSGNITTPASVAAPSIVASGKELAGHDHPAGTPPGDTGPNN